MREILLFRPNKVVQLLLSLFACVVERLSTSRLSLSMSLLSERQIVLGLRRIYVDVHSGGGSLRKAHGKRQDTGRLLFSLMVHLMGTTLIVESHMPPIETIRLAL